MTTRGDSGREATRRWRVSARRGSRAGAMAAGSATSARETWGRRLRRRDSSMERWTATLRSQWVACSGDSMVARLRGRPGGGDCGGGSHPSSAARTPSRARWWRARGTRWWQGCEGDLGAAIAAAGFIDGVLDGHFAEPVGGVLGGLDGGKVAVEGGEEILSDLVGEGAVAEEVPADTEDHGLMAVDEAGEIESGLRRVFQNSHGWQL